MTRNVIYPRVVAPMLALGVLQAFTPAQAHFDPPGPPPIRVEVDVLNLVLLEDEDDGVDGNAELLLKANVTHATHGQVTKTFAIDDLNWDVVPPFNQGRWFIRENIYKHSECTPRANVAVGTALTEIDTTKTSRVLALLGAAAATAAAGQIPVSGALVATAAGGFVISLAGILNGNDDLGVGSGVVPENGGFLIRSVGEDGRANIGFDGKTSDLLDINQCNAQGGPIVIPPTKVAAFAAGLHDALSLIPSIEAEAGNPARLNDAQLADIRNTLRSSALRIAEAVTGAAIQDVRGFEGVAGATQDFQAAQLLAASGDDAGAIAAYETAFVQAVTAGQDAIPGPELLLPFQMSLTTEMLATKPNRKPQVVVTVPGSTHPISLSVSGQPAGVQTTIVQEASDVFTLNLDIGVAVPGTYALQLTASDGVQETTRDLSLIVNPPVCDIDKNGQVDGTDVNLILAASGTQAAADDPRDIDGDALITVNDAERCS